MECGIALRMVFKAVVRVAGAVCRPDTKALMLRPDYQWRRNISWRRRRRVVRMGRAAGKNMQAAATGRA